MSCIKFVFFFFRVDRKTNPSTFFTSLQPLNGIQRILTASKNIKFVFRADRKNKMTALASDWLRHFRLLLCNHRKEFNQTYQESIFQGPLPSLCSFRPIRKARWPSWPLIFCDIFDFFPATAEWNSMKLARKQYPNVLYQVFAFFIQADRKRKMACLPLIRQDMLTHLQPLKWNSTRSGFVLTGLIPPAATNSSFPISRSKSRSRP